MNVYIDENLVPFFPEAFLNEFSVRPITSEETIRQADGLLLLPEFNVHRTPSQRAVYERLGLRMVFVTMPAEGVWYLNESEARRKKWAEVLEKCNKNPEVSAYRCDLNASRLRSLL